MDKYLESFASWYAGLSQEEYENDYLDSAKKPVFAAQLEAVKKAIGHKHYKVIYDLSYGLPEVDAFISHDKYIKAVTDSRQMQFVRKVAPNIELHMLDRPLGIIRRKSSSPDLIVALNIIKTLDIKLNRIYELWRRCSGRDVIFSILTSSDTEISDSLFHNKIFSEDILWQFAEQQEFVPVKYYESDGINWYLCYVTRDMEWISSGIRKDWYRAMEATSDEIFDRIEYIYTDIRGKKILNISSLLASGERPKSLYITDKMRDGLSIRHDIVIALDSLSFLQQPCLFAKHIIAHTDADVYIFSGRISKSKYPEPVYDEDSKLVSIAYSRRFYSNLRLQIKRKFGYSTYIMEGLGKTVCSGNGEMFVIVEAGYRIPESLARDIII